MRVAFVWSGNVHCHDSPHSSRRSMLCARAWLASCAQLTAHGAHCAAIAAVKLRLAYAMAVQRACTVVETNRIVDSTSAVATRISQRSRCFSSDHRNPNRHHLEPFVSFVVPSFTLSCRRHHRHGGIGGKMYPGICTVGHSPPAAATYPGVTAAPLRRSNKTIWPPSAAPFTGAQTVARLTTKE